MTLQRRLLHAMLALLGLAALAGVATIFVASTWLTGRVASTLTASAVSIGLAIPTSHLLGMQRARPVGMFALAAIVVGFLLALLAIWSGVVTSDWDWRFAAMTLLYAACAGPAVAFFALARIPSGSLAGLAGLVLSGAVFLLGLGAIWDLPASRIDLELAQTASMIAIAALPLVASLHGHLQDRRWWRWIGVAAGAGFVGLGVYGIWMKPGGPATWLAQCFIVMVAAGASNILVRLPLPKAQSWLPLATAAALWATAACATAANLQSQGLRDSSNADLALRATAAGAIVAACGTLAIVVLMAFNRRMLVTESHHIEAIRAISLACPRCGRRQQAPLGESRCAGCGLIVLLQVAEPRCRRCDHILFDVKGGRCPECGEPVVAPERHPGVG